jgi:hypothetical protein
MPCYDHRNEPGYVRREVEAEMQVKVDQLTRWLCSVLGTIESNQNKALKLKDPELQAWWNTHRAWDMARKEAKKEQS